MRADTEAAFRRFIEKAEQLDNSRFMAFLADPGWRVDFTHPDGPQVMKPDDEARDAFLLTFRFFIMQNEATSFRGLTKVLDDDAVSDEWKTTFRTWRSSINEYLSSSVLGYQYGGAVHRFTNREIMETFLYGGLVHANDAQAVARYGEWRRYPKIYAVLEAQCLSAILMLLRGIRLVASSCKTELQAADATRRKSDAG